MRWIYLLIACLFEIGWSGIGLKLSGGGSNIKAAIVTFAAVNMGLFFVMLASKNLPVSIVYSILVGAGIAGSALIGMFYFNEPKTALKILCIALIFIGVVGLKLMEKGS